MATAYERPEPYAATWERPMHEMVAIHHEELGWTCCPHCGGPLVASRKPRGYTHEWRMSCPPCHYLTWGSDMHAEVIAVYPTLTDIRVIDGGFRAANETE